MSAPATAKNWPIGRAPRRIELLGEKTKRPESAQHIIEFPGGAVEVSRLDDGSYWAHIIVNRDGFGDGDGDGLTSANGSVVDARIDYAHPRGVEGIAAHGEIQQVAVLIRSKKPPRVVVKAGGK